MKEDDNEDTGKAIIDHSNILDTVNPALLPDPLTPINTEIENHGVYRSLRDEIDVMKLPIECQGENQLYECEGSYFSNFTRYHDDWGDRVGTTWHAPDVAVTFV